MKVFQINIFGNLSTGKIAVDLYRTLRENGHDGVVAFARGQIAQDVPNIRIGSKRDVLIHGLMTRLTDRTGHFSTRSTKKLIGAIKDYEPDLIHLHNIHGYYLNVPILFDFLKAYGKPVVWTLHDCWAYTGHCCYYSMAGCEKWITECASCQHRNAYPASFVDRSRKNFREKKALFTTLDKLHLVPVSHWLKEEVAQSVLKDVPCTVITNGIDLEVFQPTESDFRKVHGIENKFMILSVATTWDVRKGLDDVIRLAEMLDERFAVVVVGVTEEEKKKLPPNVIGVGRTASAEELGGIYTTADVYFSASVEESFGLTVVEAMACETPVIVYNATALPELISEKSGFVVEKHDLAAVKKIAEELLADPNRDFVFDVKAYDRKVKYKMYLRLYEKLI